MRYLQVQLTNRWLKIGMTLSMALCALAALGTYSRGAFLGVAAMGAFFWIKSPKKAQWGVLIVIVGVVALSLLPEQWWDRMNTIKTYDQDASSLGRINAWWMAFNLAKDKVFGGGFMIYERAIFAIYAPDPNAVHAAHSIYFQVLGEHGFIGLFIWLTIGVTTWMTARALIKHGNAVPADSRAAELGRMVQVGMVGYAVTGAFLSLSYFDLPYNQAVIVLVALQIARQGRWNVAGVSDTVVVAPSPTSGAAAESGRLAPPDGNPNGHRKTV